MSEQPASASPPPGPGPSRRSFLRWSVFAWSMFCAWLALAGAMLLRFLFPRVLYEPDPTFVAGKRSDYPEANKVYESFRQSQAVWLVRLVEDGQDRLVALAAVCTHLGCPPNWLEAEQRFKCPCHGSGFYRNGVNFEGPAPRPLERYRIVLDAAGHIVVDKSRTFRKDLGQCNERESYLLL